MTSARPDSGPQALQTDASQKRRRVLFRLGTLILGLATAFLLGELGMRLYGYTPSFFNPLSSFHEPDGLVGYRGKPSFSGRFKNLEFDVVIAHDENGFRLADPLGNPGAEHRLLVFGDSYTWGWGVSQGEVFTDHLRRKMPGWDVRNFGLNGSGTVSQFALFKTFGEGILRPGDIVLLAFFGNDFADNVTNRLRAEVVENEVRVMGPDIMRRGGLHGILKDNSHLYNFLCFAGDRFKAVRRQGRRRTETVRRKDVSLTQSTVTTHYLRAFRDACERAGARFVAAYLPQQGELLETSNPDPIVSQSSAILRSAFFRCAEEAGVTTIDLLGPLLGIKKREGGPRLTYPADHHWNEFAHRAVAEVLEAQLPGN
ncbi:MAG: GDSL-type esterase/lipase family protein [Planctomycetota bacterium]|jgi:hypothetical protein